MYNIFKSKYNKKINSLVEKNKKKVDYEKLRLSDNYQYSSEEEQERQEKTKTDMNEIIEINEYIAKEKIDLNEELFKKYFNFQRRTDMFMLLNKTKDKTKNIELVNVINSGLKDLKEEIKKMSEAEIEIEDPESIVEIVEKILKFNEQNQQGQGLKILTPNQMLSRLPIALAQLQAGNNSNKLKNEIRQLLYSLYRSKNMTKQVYNSIMNYI